MKRMMNLVAALVCATILVGCSDKNSSGGGGSSKSEASTPQAKHEKLVKELVSIVQNEKDRTVADKFWEANVSQSFQDICKRRSEKINSSEFKKAFGAIAKSKESVKTEVIKTFEENGTVMGSAIEVTCGETKLYIVVGKAGKDKPDQILGITSSKEKALAGGN